MLDENQVDELKDVLFMPVVHQYEVKKNPQLLIGPQIDKERRGTFSNHSSEDIEAPMSKFYKRQPSFSFLELQVSHLAVMRLGIYEGHQSSPNDFNESNQSDD